MELAGAKVDVALSLQADTCDTSNTDETVAGAAGGGRAPQHLLHCIGGQEHVPKEAGR